MIDLPSLGLLSGGLVFFLLTLACFSLRDFSRSRLEEICKRRNHLVRFGQILQNYEKSLLLFETVLLLLLLLLTLLGTRSAWFEIFGWPDEPDWMNLSFLVFRVLAGTVILCLGFVVLPWTLARVRGELLLFRMWPVLSLAGKLAAPFWAFSQQLDRLVHRVFGVPEPDSEQVASLLTEELLSVVDESRREGVIETNASTMIHRVVDLQTEDVAAIMTPRTDMVTIDSDRTLDDALDEMVQNRFSRVPVIRDGIDDIVGILYARDLLTHVTDRNDETSGRTVADIARDVLYAPESQGIGDLLEAMRQQKVHMAIIVDEYSGVSGLVTLEDILEEIVGEISDEYDSEDQELQKVHQNGCTEVDARYHLDDLNEEFGYGFPEDEEFDTIGGFALSCFGRIPSTGEEFFWRNLRLTVLEADERRLIQVRIEITTPKNATGETRSSA